MKVPYNDLSRLHAPLKKQIINRFEGILDTSSFIGGNYVTSFSKKLSNILGNINVQTCANGTDALIISLKALGILPGDEVIVPAHTWISTSEAVTAVGGIPVFCDTSRDDYLLDVDKVEEVITSKTKAIIAVHLYGQMCDMDVLKRICVNHNLFLIEDAAQAHLSLYKDKMVGQISDIATFSFFPGKNLGAIGDAGSIVSSSDELIKNCKRIANHGSLFKGEFWSEGYNSRLDNVQAAVLDIKVDKLTEYTDQRRAIASLYSDAFRHTDIISPSCKKGRYHTYHVYCVRVPERDRVKLELAANGIETQITYEKILPHAPAYRALNHRGRTFEVSATYVKEILSLPIFPGMSVEEANYVIDKLKEIV